MEFLNTPVTFYYKQSGEDRETTIHFTEEDGVSTEDHYFGNIMIEHLDMDSDEFQYEIHE